MTREWENQFSFTVPPQNPNIVKLWQYNKEGEKQEGYCIIFYASDRTSPWIWRESENGQGWINDQAPWKKGNPQFYDTFEQAKQDLPLALEYIQKWKTHWVERFSNEKNLF